MCKKHVLTSESINEKIISIGFIRYPFLKDSDSGEAAVSSGKSGHYCSALKMLGSVLKMTDPWDGYIYRLRRQKPSACVG